MKHLSKSKADLLKRQLQKNWGKFIPRTYSPDLRYFSLTLHYYSPRAYTYVRESFNSCLPHPKTIYKWYKTVDGEPGFNIEALNAIKTFVNHANYTVVDCIVYDEMSLMKK